MMAVLRMFVFCHDYHYVMFDYAWFVSCQDNPSEKDVNQGTLVVFNLDSSVSNDELRELFGVYGEIKEVNLIAKSYNCAWQNHRL